MDFMPSVPGTVINYTPAASGTYNGCPHNAHDANYTTFHRIERFREHLVE